MSTTSKLTPETPATKRIRQLVDVRSFLADVYGAARMGLSTAEMERLSERHANVLDRIIDELTAGAAQTFDGTYDVSLTADEIAALSTAGKMMLTQMSGEADSFDTLRASSHRLGQIAAAIKRDREKAGSS